jgi:hypothetical protein
VRPLEIQSTESPRNPGRFKAWFRVSAGDGELRFIAPPTAIRFVGPLLDLASALDFWLLQACPPFRYDPLAQAPAITLERVEGSVRAQARGSLGIDELRVPEEELRTALA